MKLISFAASGRSSYGAVVGDGVVDFARRLGDRYPTLRAAIAGGELDGATAEVSGVAPDIALSQVTVLPPITDPDKIICAGRNYRAHAAEAGGPPPENPQVFLRLVNTLVAHNQPMVCPRISGDFDYEGELAVIIGKPGRHIAKSDALSHVFGYTCFNDGSIRDVQFKHSIAAGKTPPDRISVSKTCSNKPLPSKSEGCSCAVEPETLGIPITSGSFDRSLAR